MKTQKNIIKSLSLIVLVLIVAISCDNRPTAKSDGKTGTATLVEAISEFTIDNVYFGTYSACERKQ